MTTTRRAPYKHADGSNCWTKNCSKNSAISGRSHHSDYAHRSKAKPDSYHDAPMRDSLISVMRSGSQMNEAFQFSTVFSQGRSYSPEHVRPAKNAGFDLIRTKPQGGLWVATVDDSGIDSWTEFCGGTVEGSESARTHMRFKPEARVLVVDTLDDYRSILTAYPHHTQKDSDSPDDDYISLFVPKHFNTTALNSDGSTRRNIDWEKLSKNYDAVMVTWQGLYSCGKGSGVDMGNDVSLYNWDFESVFVMNKNAVQYEEK